MGVVAVGAHPDDIELGCGGTLLRHVANGDPIWLIILSTGERSGEATRIRQAEQSAAAALLGQATVVWGGFEGGAIPSGPASVELIESAIREADARIVYCPTRADDHQEHVKAANATLAASRTVPVVLHYEGVNIHGFDPTLFVDVSDTIENKRALIECHASQVERNRIATDDAVARARFRGIQGLSSYAEAFEVHRFVWEPATTR